MERLRFLNSFFGAPASDGDVMTITVLMILHRYRPARQMKYSPLSADCGSLEVQYGLISDVIKYGGHCKKWFFV
jgi:hypothetical protein